MEQQIQKNQDIDVCVLTTIQYFNLLQLKDRPNDLYFAPVFAEIGYKFILNSISTGAQIQKGRVFKNTMINVGPTNNKLFYRCIGIIEKLTECTNEIAHTSLLRAIYDLGDNEIPQTIVDTPISKHIEIGTSKLVVLPIAMLLATGKFQCQRGVRKGTYCQKHRY